MLYMYNLQNVKSCDLDSLKSSLYHISQNLFTSRTSFFFPIRDGRDALEIEAEAILRRLEAEEEAEKARRDLMVQLEEQQQLRYRMMIMWK